MSNCPESGKIGSLEARMNAAERDIDNLKETALTNANAILTGRVEREIENKWLKRTALIIGYIVLAGCLMVAGKVTGAAEWLVKLVRVW